MNPSNTKHVNSGPDKKNAFLVDEHNNYSRLQATPSNPQTVSLRTPLVAAWKPHRKTSLSNSNINSHETTPLFGLWQGHSSQIVLNSHGVQSYNRSSGLFLPGQNGTNIIAHIGTTVIMDCRIIRPNLEENGPVRIFLCPL